MTKSLSKELIDRFCNEIGIEFTDVSDRIALSIHGLEHGGPPWHDMVARVTADAGDGRVVKTELKKNICRSDEHCVLPNGFTSPDSKADIDTVLIYKYNLEGECRPER